MQLKFLKKIALNIQENNKNVNSTCPLSGNEKK